MLWFNKPADITAPFNEDLYKVSLLLDSLNPLLRTHVVDRSKYLEHLHIGSEYGKIHLQGKFIINESSLLKFLGYESILFLAEFIVKGCEGNDVVMKVIKLRLYNPSGSKLDLLRFISKLFSRLRKRIIRTIAESIPRILSARNNFSEVVFRSDYFLADLPSLGGSLGDIKILSVRPQKDNQVHFYVHSNLILINLVHAFGPECLRMQELHLDQESQELLWDAF